MATFTSSLNVFTDRLVPPALRADAEVFRHAKRAVLFDGAYLIWVCGFAGFLTALGAPHCGLITLWCTLPILVSLRLIEQGRSPTLAVNVLCFGGWITLTCVAFKLGGATASMIWLANLPLLAVLTCGLTWGLVWTAIPLATVVAFGLARAGGVPLPSELSAVKITIFDFVAVGGLLVCQVWVSAIRVGVEQRAHVALTEANRRLASARADLAALRQGFGCSFEEWQTLKREKAALEYALQQRLVSADEIQTQDSLLDDDETALDDILGLTRRSGH